MSGNIPHLGTEKERPMRGARFLVSALRGLQNAPSLAKRLDRIEARLEVLERRFDDSRRTGRGSR